MSFGSSQSFPLLEVPESVKDKILFFVSSGNGGLRGILNLRLVCQTTKAWVDTIPKRQANVVFSRAHVTITCDLDSIRHFLTSPPPFEVNSLSLFNEDLLGNTKISSEEEEAWSRFSMIWNKKLESMKLQSILCSETKIPSVLLNLMQLPNLHKLELCQSFIVPKDSMSCFQKVRELHVKSVHAEDWTTSELSEFYLRLENNSNLKILSVSLSDIKEFVGITKLINHRKEDSQLQLSIKMVKNNLIQMALQDGRCRTAFQNFAASIAASKSLISLRIENLRNFERLITEFCPREIYLELLSKVESVKSWEPNEDSMPLLEYLPQLKRLKCIITHDSSVDINRLTFPPLLQKLGFSRGFNSFGSLPPTLTSLNLCHWECEASKLVSSLNLLRVSCPGLLTLWLDWQLIEDKVKLHEGSLERSHEFSKLKTLHFMGSLRRANVEDCRVVISNAFDWKNLKLQTLELSFYVTGDVPMLCTETLTDLLEGQSARTLVTVFIAKKSVTPEGLPLLEKLESLASANSIKRNYEQCRGQLLAQEIM